MIREEIHPKQKSYHARGGDAHIFGQDSDVRRKMSEAAAIERFEQVWAAKLEPEVRKAPMISAEQVRELLEEKQRSYVTDAGQYRQFVIDSANFVVRLNKDATESGVCDGIWALGAHRDPARLCMYFDSVAEKEDFDGLARSLGYEPRVLAVELVTDFMRKHRPPESRV